VNVDAFAPGMGPWPAPSCEGNGKRVVAGDSANSLVYKKIQGAVPVPCGVRMPEDGLTNGYLNTSQITTIQNWIDQGANDN
jgi:hypothetical protein